MTHAVVDSGGVFKFFALSSYAFLPSKPAFFPLRHKRNPTAPSIARPPTIDPTAIPAFAPVERPPPLEDWPDVADWDAKRSVLDGLLPEELAVGVGALKSSEVTLKQGTLIEKSMVSTKVCKSHQIVKP
jgi:hypothetical protein